MPNSLADLGTGVGPIAAPQAPGNPLMTAATAPAEPSTPQKTTTPAQIKEAIQKQAALDRHLRKLLKDGKPVARKDIIAMAVDLVATRVMTAPEVAGYLNDLPQEPHQVRDWAAKHAAATEKGLEQLMTMIHGAEAPPVDPMMSGQPAATPGGMSQP